MVLKESTQNKDPLFILELSSYKQSMNGNHIDGWQRMLDAVKVVPVTTYQPHFVKSEETAPSAEAPKEEVQTSSAVVPPKAVLAVDLFNMLSVDDSPSQNSSENTNDDSAWAEFQMAGQASTSAKKYSTKTVDGSKPPTTGLEDLFIDSPSLEPSAPAKPPKNVKSDIMSLLEKSNMATPFGLNKKQLIMLAQQQALLMAAAAQSNGASKAPINLPQPGANRANVAAQNWPNVGYQIPGMAMPMMSHNEIQKLMQMGNLQALRNAGNSSSYPHS